MSGIIISLKYDCYHISYAGYLQKIGIVMGVGLSAALLGNKYLELNLIDHLQKIKSIQDDWFNLIEELRPKE